MAILNLPITREAAVAAHDALLDAGLHAGVIRYPVALPASVIPLIDALHRAALTPDDPMPRDSALMDLAREGYPPLALLNARLSGLIDMTPRHTLAYTPRVRS